MRRGLAGLVLLWAAGPAAVATPAPLQIGSKAFTESVILAEIARGLLLGDGIPSVHHAAIGGTRVLWEALRSGQIDIYPEYTGTIAREILSDQALAADDIESLRRALAGHGILLGPALGFNNAYALGVRETSWAAGVRRISDLLVHPDLKLAFSNEFMDRGDGWRALQRAYGLPQAAIGIDHSLAYRGLRSGAADVVDLYTTDAEIAHHAVAVLADDRGFFPRYEAHFLIRAELPAAAAVSAALSRLAGTIDAPRMRAMNAAVKFEGLKEAEVAATFLRDELGVSGSRVPRDSVVRETLGHLGDHLALVAVSLLAAILVAIPAGILAARHRRLGAAILAIAGVLQTIPSLALLVFMIPIFGIGAVPAIWALFLYSLLPIVRNTAVGIMQIPRGLRDSADALGLSPAFKLWRIELPLALPGILAGIKIAAVLNIGTATLGALIGAGGLGQPILTGIRLNDTALVLQGAVPAALLALSVQGLFALIERWLVPRGLRL